MVKLLKYLFIGLVQGISEVLPISSSGHLILVQYMLGIGEEGLAFEIFLHLASLFAVIFFLRKRIWKLLTGFCKFVFKKDKESKNDFMYCIYLLISTIPAVIAALFLKKYIETSSILVVGILLLVNATMLLVLTRFKGTKKISEMKWHNALTIGLFQCAGMFPGISRSGSCLCGAFTNKLDKEEAADYAFLLFIPAVLGAVVLDLPSIGALFTDPDIWFILAAFVVTLFTTYYAFKILLTIIRKGKLSYFSYYCYLVGGITIIYCLINNIR